jgi:hypothetical protein
MVAAMLHPAIHVLEATVAVWRAGPNPELEPATTVGEANGAVTIRALLT